MEAGVEVDTWGVGLALDYTRFRGFALARVRSSRCSPLAELVARRARLTQWPSSIHIPAKLLPCRLGLCRLCELNHALPSTSIAIEQDLRDDDIADRLEELYQVLVRRRPREL